MLSGLRVSNVHVRTARETYTDFVHRRLVLTLKNTISEDQGIETNTMISFFLFWLLSVPFLCMHPNNLRWLFMAKSVIVPIAWIAILIWAFVSTDGGEMWNQKATIEGSAYSWAFLSSLTSVIGNYATLSVNQVSHSNRLTISGRTHPSWHGTTNNHY